MVGLDDDDVDGDNEDDVEGISFPIGDDESSIAEVVSSTLCSSCRCRCCCTHSPFSSPSSSLLLSLPVWRLPLLVVVDKDHHGPPPSLTSYLSSLVDGLDCGSCSSLSSFFLRTDEGFDGCFVVDSMIPFFLRERPEVLDVVVIAAFSDSVVEVTSDSTTSTAVVEPRIPPRPCRWIDSSWKPIMLSKLGGTLFIIAMVVVRQHSKDRRTVLLSYIEEKQQLKPKNMLYRQSLSYIWLLSLFLF